MISDLEQSLAALLGSRIAAPFTGHAVVGAPATPPPTPTVAVAVTSASPAAPAFGGGLPKTTPALAAGHRVVQLDCTVTVQVVVRPGQDRSELADGVDQVLWVLDDPEVRSGAALSDGTDQGFALDALAVSGAAVPIDPAATPPAPSLVTATASGWFWPRGIVGVTGRPIGQVRVRGVVTPVLVSPASPTATPGGPTVSITVSVQVAGSMTVDAAGAAAQPLPFTAVVATLRGPGGPPSGTLTGGAGGTTTLRTYPVSGGVAVVQYTPPGRPATDTIAVSLDDGAGGAGLVVGSVQVEVR